MGASLALMVTSLVASPTAHANGRFPFADQIATGPDHALLLRTSFGLLLRDTQGTMRWLCEDSIGYSGAQDPAVAFLGTEPVAAVYEGVERGLEGGCSFQKAADLAAERIVDLSTERQSPTHAVAVSATDLDGGGVHVQVFETLDAGATWTAAGQPLEAFGADTIDVAPSRPQRLYVSGSVLKQGKHLGLIATSDDRGASWSYLELPLPTEVSIFLAGVDPTNPDRVYARTRGAMADRLLVSSDGGTSFAEVLSAPGGLPGFAVSPDGAWLAAAGPTIGLRIASRDTLTFEARSDVSLQGLAWTDEGLFASASALKAGFALARTVDQGQTWQTILSRLADVPGPLTGCSSGSSATQVCVPEWPGQHSQLVLTDGLASSGGKGGAAGEATAGAAGEVSLGGAPPTGAGAAGQPDVAGSPDHERSGGGGVSGAGSEQAEEGDSGGCMAARGRDATAPLGLVGLLWMARRRRPAEDRVARRSR